MSWQDRSLKAGGFVSVSDLDIAITLILDDIGRGGSVGNIRNKEQ